MGSFSLLYNIPALTAENQINTNQANLQNSLTQLSSGQRINSGADDPAGLSIANGLHANELALNQSVQNANTGIGLLQIADGALSQINNILNSAITLATEASNGTESSTQSAALNNEFQQLMQEVDSIGSNTTYNGNAIFTAATTTIFMSDGTAAGVDTVGVTTGALSSSTLSLSTSSLTTTTTAQAALTAVSAAINTVDTSRGTIGASIDRLQNASNVMNQQVQNVTAAENGIMAANIPQVVGHLSQQQILAQTGISALSQANSTQQLVLKLLQ
ncbi:MAG: flagellin [Terriglobales bacterium]